MLGAMSFRSAVLSLVAAVLASAVPALAPAHAAAPAEPARVEREIIPGSELMTSQERERYRLRLQGAGTPEERERLRAEHVKAMEERARVRGLRVSDPTRERQGAKK